MTKNISITAEEYAAISNIQQEILEKLVVDAPSIDILSALCFLAESLLPNSVASIMMVDEKSGLMSVLCAPSIPQQGHDALANLQPGPCGGSCGNAVFHNKPQFVQNTFEDKRWGNLRQIAYNFNLCSCWSMPIRNAKNVAIGSFALSSFEHRTPAPFHEKLLETAGAIVSLVLKRQIREKRLLLLSTALSNASEGVVITDENNLIIEVNPAFEKVYGYSEENILGKNPRIFSSEKQESTFYRHMWKEINSTDKWSGEIVNQHQDGHYISQWMSISVIRDELGNIQNYMSILSDLTELKAVQKQIEDMAYFDAITKLHNKTYLEQQLLENKQEHTLIILNINNFSYINAAYGFDVGDEILKTIAKTLQKNFSAHSIYRLNSDEFAMLFDSKVDITYQIKAIQHFFYNSLLKVDDISLHIAFTYGAALGHKNLLRNSSLALKQAKTLGKNRYQIFDDKNEASEHSARHQFIASNNMLHSALEEGRVIPFFQGIYDNKKQKITKFEVLARIEEQGKIISPYHFLEPAKLSGLLPEITRVIIEKSFKIMSDYHYKFSLNITEDDLSQNFLVELLKKTAVRYNIAPQRIILEILEGVSASGKKNHIKQLIELKSAGYALAIDDFGTEYSNFERILDLDIDFLKIDAKYIKDIDVNRKSYEITRAITFFAHNANIPCIAEFVHSESVQNIIMKLGIDYSQGYYFSEPSASL
jgi:PAS domain S-box-containing protein/diguanylate cyclase (GGDEF)-like protein